jgi:1,4-dihydroxy-2-naphthoyl-CoA hydrolase
MVKVIWFGGRRPSAEELQVSSTIGLHRHLGMEVVDCGDDWLRIRMPVDERTRQPFGRLPGGASVALAETVGSIAANHCIDGAQLVAVGQEINANHIRPAYDGWVYAIARPEALGRATHVWTIRIEDEAGKLVCISRFTVAVIARDRR